MNSPPLAPASTSLCNNSPITMLIRHIQAPTQCTPILQVTTITLHTTLISRNRTDLRHLLQQRHIRLLTRTTSHRKHINSNTHITNLIPTIQSVTIPLIPLTTLIHILHLPPQPFNANTPTLHQPLQPIHHLPLSNNPKSTILPLRILPLIPVPIIPFLIE